MTPPAANWIRFLRNYGPLPTNGNLFDEHVNVALKRAGVRPIELPTPFVDEMFDALSSGLVRSLLIAGTAGDGKTFHARKLWVRLGGDARVWDKSDKAKRLDRPDGTALTFVKDLSELTPDEGLEVLSGLEASVLDAYRSHGYVIACNHGQILERLRQFRSPSSGAQSRLLAGIQATFLNSGPGIDGLRVFDLGGADQRQSLRAVIRVVAEHEEWGRCAECPLHSGERICPILTNRDRALSGDDGGTFVTRLENLVDLARLNGDHLPVRDLLALVTNMLLGHPEVKEQLMTCTDVARIQDEGTAARASIYRNVFGANLIRRRAMSRPSFRTLGSFGIGDESTNTIDGLLVYGRHDTTLRDDFDRLVGNDPLYGADATYLARQARYLEGDESAREDETVVAFLERLRDQRQRLFFTLPNDSSQIFPFWSLSMFRFAGDYLVLRTCCSQKIPVSPNVRARVVRGLNRVITGLLLDNTDSIFIASSGSNSQSRISVLCEVEVPARRTGQGFGLSFRLTEATRRPCIDIGVGISAAAPVSLELTPIRFEFLCRVAEGALPSSFSNECYEDLMAFKVRLLRQAQLVRRQGAMAMDDGAHETLPDHQELQLAFIEIEQNGSGFLKRITVGGAQ